MGLQGEEVLVDFKVMDSVRTVHGGKRDRPRNNGGWFCIEHLQRRPRFWRNVPGKFCIWPTSGAASTRSARTSRLLGRKALTVRDEIGAPVRRGADYWVLDLRPGGIHLLVRTRHRNLMSHAARKTPQSRQATADFEVSEYFLIIILLLPRN